MSAKAWTEEQAVRKHYVAAEDAKNSGRYVYWEPSTKGFGIRVFKSGERRYIASARVKSDGAWKNRLFVVGKPGDDNVRDARKAAQKILAELRSGRDERGEEAKQRSEQGVADSELAKVTLRQALDYYCENRNVAAGTKRVLRNVVENHGGVWLDRPLLDLDPPAVKRLYRDTGEKIGKAAAARIAANDALPADQRSTYTRPASYFNGEVADKLMRNLSVVWNTWTDDHADKLAKQKVFVPRNPVRTVKTVRVQRKRTRQTLNTDQLRTLFKALPKYDAHTYEPLLFRLLVLTGLRVGAAMSLEWDHVKADRIEVPTTIDRGKVRVAKINTDEDAQPLLVIPVTKAIAAVLKELRALGTWKTEHRLVKAEQAAKYLFPSLRSKSGHLESQQHFVRELGTHAGVVFTAHTTRRSFASLLNALGCTTTDVAAMLNHSESRGGGNVTEGYIRVDLSRRREILDRVHAELEAIAGKRG